MKMRHWSKETKKIPNTVFFSSHQFTSSIDTAEIRYLFCGNFEQKRLPSQDINTPSVLVEAKRQVLPWESAQK